MGRDCFVMAIPSGWLRDVMMRDLPSRCLLWSDPASRRLWLREKGWWGMNPNTCLLPRGNEAWLAFLLYDLSGPGVLLYMRWEYYGPW